MAHVLVSSGEGEAFCKEEPWSTCDAQEAGRTQNAGKGSFPLLHG